MSGTPQDQVEFDFWDFVSCAKCRMPFALDNGAPTVPFWLTECGHVICNTHLNPDQSCSQCGSRDIQLAPLQREMEAPLSDWFQPIPQALDAVAFAIKFQQDILASQLRYYRSRHHQYRHIIEKLKREVSDFKKENDALRHENERIRLQMHHPNDDTQYIINANGKRQVFSMQESRVTSSPRSINTPIGPSRLTLQPGQQVPDLSSHVQEQNPRPISRRSLEQYAYKRPESQKFTPPTLTYSQTAPQLFQRSNLQMSGQNAYQPTRGNPESSSSRFKPAPAVSLSTGQVNQRPSIMGPPATPHHHHHPQTTILGRNASDRAHFPPPSRQQASLPPGTSGQQLPPSAAAPQRFFPVTGPFSINSRGVTNNASNRTPTATSGQRLPFVPPEAK